MNVFALLDCSEGRYGADVLGVFDHSAIPDDELIPYFGKFARKSLRDIRDSGVEWELVIVTDDGEVHRLMLHEYTINEI